MHIEQVKKFFLTPNIIALTFLFGLKTVTDVYTMCCPNKAKGAALEFLSSFLSYL